MRESRKSHFPFSLISASLSYQATTENPPEPFYSTQSKWNILALFEIVTKKSWERKRDPFSKREGEMSGVKKGRDPFCYFSDHSIWASDKPRSTPSSCRSMSLICYIYIYIYIPFVADLWVPLCCYLFIYFPFLALLFVGCGFFVNLFDLWVCNFFPSSFWFFSL